ncbi:MAG: ATP-dependent helicase [Thermoplasmata archaeon]
MKKNGVKVIIVDEFQDMTNLMLLFVLCLSEYFDIWLSGDLDQTIYDFAGVDRSFILRSLRKISNWYIQLDVSYRVPELIFKKALALIGKDYKTNKPGGKIKIISQVELYDVLSKSITEPTLFLCRVSHFFPHDLLNSLSLFYSYAARGTVNTNMPSWYNYYEELKNKELTRKNLHFFVKILQKLGYISILSAEDEVELVSIIKENGKTSKKTSKKNLLSDCARRVMYCLDMVDDVFYDYYRFQFLKVKNMRKSNLLIATIHASKGGEAKNVIVDMRITKSCLDSKCEKNVLYVAFTRSSENLYLYVPSAGLSYFSVFNLLD